MFRSLPLAASASAAVLVDHNGTEGRDFCEHFFIATS
jgi:hypothetical protein